MKKLFLLGILVSIGFTACEKDQIQTTNDSLTTMSSKQHPTVLSVDSFSDYQSIIEQPEGTEIPGLPSGFISLRSILNQLDKLKEVGEDAYYSSPYIADTIYEDYGRLLDVLNEDKIVKLNGNYVKVDLTKDSVYVINASLNNAYDIINNNRPNDSMKVFSTSINVNFHIWFRIKIPGSGCGESAAKKRKEKTYRIGSSKYRTKEKLVYQSAGIYFSVLAKAKNQHKSLWIWWSWAGGQPSLYMTLTWKVKCGEMQSYWQGYAVNWTGPGFEANANIATFRPYSSTAPLTSFDVSCTYYTPCGSGDYLHIRY